MNSIPALAVAILSFWFMFLVFRQWRRKYRPNTGFWTLSLFLSGIASCAYAITLWVSPHSLWSFYLYYLCGAMWMPSMMGLGSLALVGSRRTISILLMLILALGTIGSILLLRAPVSTAALKALNGGAGTNVIAPQSGWLIPLIVLNSGGAFLVLFVAVLSIWRRIRESKDWVQVSGNLWLAAGILVISAAGSAARLGWPGAFWTTMLVGWVITFMGYRRLTPASERNTPESVQ